MSWSGLVSVMVNFASPLYGPVQNCTYGTRGPGKLSDTFTSWHSTHRSTTQPLRCSEKSALRDHTHQPVTILLQNLQHPPVHECAVIHSRTKALSKLIILKAQPLPAAARQVPHQHGSCLVFYVMRASHIRASCFEGRSFIRLRFHNHRQQHNSTRLRDVFEPAASDPNLFGRLVDEQVLV